MVNKKEVILIVDDIVSNIEILNGVLGNDYEILFAANGKDAIDIAVKEVPDLILLDVIMPGMDGYEVCSRLKSEEKTRDIPVIFVTAMDHEEDESKGFNSGVVDYITKPVRPSIVLSRVRNHLELKRYRDSLKALSTIDGLTGVANRRRFDEALNNEWRRGKRLQTTLSLLMMDIDCFKAFNDHYGHLAGDECLCQLAKGIGGAARRSGDLLARYGGDEFTYLLPETDNKAAALIAERIREKVKLLNIPHAYSGIEPYVTLSIGAATTIPSELCTQSDLIHFADDLLYEAKKAGRNRFVNREMMTITSSCLK
jgi:diguanylate cyclase (GGDEF)-like protein